MRLFFTARSIRRALPTLVLCTLAALSACSHQDGGDAAPAAPSGGLPALPRPAESLGDARQVSAAVLTRNGADFEPGLPNSNVAANGALATFSPHAYFGSSNQTPVLDGLAYAVYLFNVEGLTEEPILRLLLSQSVTASNDFAWLGIADWDSDSWVWQLAKGPETGGGTSLAGFADPGGNVMVALLATGFADFDAYSLTLSQQDESAGNDSLASSDLQPGPRVKDFYGRVDAADDPVDYIGLPYIDRSKFDITCFFPEATGLVQLSVVDNAGNVVVAPKTSALIDGSGLKSMTLSPSTASLEESDYPVHLVVEALEGFRDYRLNVSRGNFPQLAVAVGPTSGQSPLTVNFDATGTLSEDPVQEYSLSFNKANQRDFVTADPIFDYTFSEEKIHIVFVGVLASGYGDNERVAIVVGENPYDEREDNDSIAEANELPAAKASGFLGSVGFDDVNQVYDGDTTDFYWLDVPAGQTLHVSRHNTDKVVLSILNAAGDEIGARSYDYNSAQYSNSGGSAERVYLRVAKYITHFFEVDYELRWKFGQPPVITNVTVDPTSAAPPVEVQLSVAASDPDGTVELAQWVLDLQIASPAQEFSAEGFSIEHTYDSHYLHNILVQVTDNDGLWAQDDSVVMTIM